ncbi:MAG: SIMPL domain-containing protein [Candidatus Poribacteria bacterium]
MKKLTNFMMIMILLVPVVFYACGDTDNITLSSESQNQMRVVGSSSINKSPDIATTQIGVQTIAKEVDPAINENNRKAEAIIAALRNMGIAEKDIRTSSFNITPQRDYQQPNYPLIGYQIDNMLSVTFRDLTKVGKGLQNAINAGANNIYGVSFTLADPESARSEARTLAIQDARKKAENMASAAGITLGKIISVNEVSSAVSVDSRNYDKAAAEGQVPIQPGELGVVVQVELVYLIK